MAERCALSHVERQLRKALEEEFDADLSSKKEVIRAEVRDRRDTCVVAQSMQQACYAAVFVKHTRSHIFATVQVTRYLEEQDAEAEAQAKAKNDVKEDCQPSSEGPPEDEDAEELVEAGCVLRKASATGVD